MSKQHIEKKVANTILQRPVEINISGRKFNAPQPTIGTLIMMSEEIATLPKMEISEDAQIVNVVLSNAKDCKAIARIIAVALVGAKEIKEDEKQHTGKAWRMMRPFRRSKVDEIADWLLNNASPSEITKAYANVISTLEVGDFFGVITFLAGMNATAAKVN